MSSDPFLIQEFTKQWKNANFSTMKKQGNMRPDPRKIAHQTIYILCDLINFNIDKQISIINLRA